MVLLLYVELRETICVKRGLVLATHAPQTADAQLEVLSGYVHSRVGAAAVTGHDLQVP
jgi:hypothetical protein